MSEGEFYLIGIDIGSSAVKGVLMSAGGTVVSSAKREAVYQTPRDGWIQFDVKEWYASIAAVIRRLTAALPEGGTVAGLSMASASGNTVLVDDRGEPTIPAISWMDTRVRAEMDRVFGKLDESQAHERTGWPLLPMFPLAHLSWLKCHEPELLASSARVCMSTEYMNYRLTGEWGIDSSTATTFYLQDQTEEKWHLPLLDRLGIPEHKLPPIHSPGTVLGAITVQASADTGLATGTPVVLGAFDHPCAARGAGIFDEGQLLLSCGTSWVGFFPAAARRTAIEHKLLTDPFLQPAGPWGAMFSLPAVAASVDRYIERYISDGPERYQAFDRLAASSGPGAGGLLVNPELEEEVDTRRYAKADIARAVMEGTVFLLNRRKEQLARSGISFASVTMVGGPSETHPWPQIVADVLGMDVSTVNGSCAGAAGAAILAGIGAGLYADERDAFKQLSFAKRIRLPDQAAHQVYKEQYRRFVEKYS